MQWRWFPGNRREWKSSFSSNRVHIGIGQLFGGLLSPLPHTQKFPERETTIRNWRDFFSLHQRIKINPCHPHHRHHLARHDGFERIGILRSLNKIIPFIVMEQAPKITRLVAGSLVLPGEARVCVVSSLPACFGSLHKWMLAMMIGFKRTDRSVCVRFKRPIDSGMVSK